MSSNLPSNKSNRNAEANSPLLNLPPDLQINILTFLRSYDLSAVQKTCRFYARPELIDTVVKKFADEIYPSNYTLGFDSSKSPLKGKLCPSKENSNQEKTLYNFQHLRNMELLVVARALGSPEPSSGFFVSKSWCKTALRWLEVQQEQAQRVDNKLSKKKQRLRDRKLSDASPPWPNANIDLLCEHQNLQHCSSGRSARARRRLLDRQAWKILKKLFPDSTQLESAMGECLQCTLEAETEKKNESDRIEKEKLERKRPLADEKIRRFYTRRTGVPSQSVLSATNPGQCPLEFGNYYVLPRAWCYAWRRYIKTGEGGASPPPDAACLLCDAHRLALIPPHLEAYLYGESLELLVPQGDNVFGEPATSQNAFLLPIGAGVGGAIPGQGPDPETLEAMRAVGIADPAELSRQLVMFRQLGEIHRPVLAPPAAPAALPSSSLSGRNEMLDCENYSVVEILTETEFLALESCWGQGHGFRLQFSVGEKGVVFHTTQTCRECDATGRCHPLHIKNRNRRAIRKTVVEKQARPQPSLEY
ncbi:hypothetical protein ACA910_021026 [Epithemia clementina (nom. ined.)]